MSFLQSAVRQFTYYKSLGDSTLSRLSQEQLQWQYDGESNSIAMIVNHLHGNMLSRWTNFKTEDGEKQWRNRDQEFESHPCTKESLLLQWEDGWTCLFNALESIKDSELDQIIYIRHEPHTIIEAINRQLAHYPYHVGQMVYLGKMILSNSWSSLSIPKGKSDEFNESKKQG